MCPTRTKSGDATAPVLLVTVYIQLFRLGLVIRLLLVLFSLVPFVLCIGSLLLLLSLNWVNKSKPKVHRRSQEFV